MYDLDWFNRISIKTECALGLQYKFNIPFMYLNTVGFYTDSISRSGSPAPYSITPVFAKAMTDNMNFIERVTNSIIHVMLQTIHFVSSILVFNHTTRLFMNFSCNNNFHDCINILVSFKVLICDWSCGHVWSGWYAINELSNLIKLFQLRREFAFL